MLTCTRCGKRLSRKTARQIDGKPVCSACLFGQKPKPKLQTRWRCETCRLELTVPAETSETGYACCYAGMTYLGVERRDSGSGPQGGDNSLAPGEAPQSGLSASEGIAHPLSGPTP